MKNANIFFRTLLIHLPYHLNACALKIHQPIIAGFLYHKSLLTTDLILSQGTRIHITKIIHSLHHQIQKSQSQSFKLSNLKAKYTIYYREQL